MCNIAVELSILGLIKPMSSHSHCNFVPEVLLMICDTKKLSMLIKFGVISNICLHY